MKEATILKLVFIFLAFFEAFLMGIIPIKSKTFKDSPKILGVANAFAGGVFISIALLHILPEQSETELDDKFKEQYGDYPLAFLFTVVGYTIILILDKILIDAHDHGNHDKQEDFPQIEVHDIANWSSNQLNADDINQTPPKQQVIAAKRSIAEGYTQSQNVVRASMLLRQSMNDMVNHPNDPQNLQRLSMSQNQMEKAYMEQARNSLRKSERVAARLKLTQSQVQVKESGNITDHFVDKDNIDPALAGVPQNIQVVTKKHGILENLSPFVLIIGLGVHSLFEGIAVGLAPDFQQATFICLAIVMHKGAAAMALGIANQKAFPDRDNFIIGLIFVFSLMTPIGIIIGMFVEGSSKILELLFNSLAAGTFIYIGCSEVIIEEFSQPENKYLKLLSFLIGMIIIGCLRLLEGDDG